MSPSSRRAWIEIEAQPIDCEKTAVALLAEGVDRNYLQSTSYAKAAVALLAEGVDRNKECRFLQIPNPASPSSRRAWIEI